MKYVTVIHELERHREGTRTVATLMLSCQHQVERTVPATRQKKRAICGICD